MSTITSLGSNDSGETSRGVINTNFTNLNTDKMETSVLDTDVTLAANSDARVATQKAVKTYVTSAVAATDVSCRVYQTATTTMTNSYTYYVLDFGAEAFDTDTMHDNSTNPSRITFTTAGKYLIGAQVYRAQGIDIGVQIRLDGSTVIATHHMSETGSGVGSVSVTTLYTVTAGQYIEILSTCSNAGSTTSGDSNTHVWAVKVN